MDEMINLVCSIDDEIAWNVPVSYEIYQCVKVVAKEEVGCNQALLMVISIFATTETKVESFNLGLASIFCKIRMLLAATKGLVIA